MRSVRSVRLVLFALAALLISGAAHADDDAIAVAPPLAPYRRGPMVEGTLGVYAPSGRLKRVSAPGPWMRIAIGYDITRWLGLYVAGDAAFLSTNRAPPPPGERAYAVYGFGGGARFSIGIGNRVRIPIRVELGVHRTNDRGVLGTYGFNDTADLGLSYGAMLGLEWRAMSRHFGLILEGGVRNDSNLTHAARAESPLAIISGLTLHYTL